MRSRASESSGKALMLLDLGITSEMLTKDFGKILSLATNDVFNCIWIGEDIDKPHDIFVQASYALMKTSLNVGTGIASIYARNLTNIARASSCLNEVGNERFRLGIGVGGHQTLKKMGITAEKPVRTMREAVFLIRRFWRGETVTFENGTVFHLNSYSPRYGLGQKIPIYIGVRGPRMLRLAGEIADGVILSGPTTYLDKAVKLVHEGARRAGRNTKDINVVVWIPTMLTTGKEDLDRARKVVAFVLADTPESVIELSGLSLRTLEDIHEEYSRGGVEFAANHVTREILEDMILCGTAKELCDSFLALEKIGANEVVFGPPFGADRESAITQIARAWRKTR